MAVVTLLLFYLLSLSSGYIIMDDDVTTLALALPSEYHFKAEKIDLVEHTREPIELWYSAEYNRSRIDVDEGTVRRYYYWSYEDPDKGAVYTVSPKTTEWAQNEMACVSKNISEEGQNHDAFPTEYSYVYVGNRQHEGRDVDVWEDIYEGDGSKVETTLYTYKGSRDVDVPVQIVQKGYDLEKGTLDAHVIYNYYNYNPVICDDDLDAEKEYDCSVALDDFHGTMKSLHPSFDGDLDVAFDSFKKHHGKGYKSNDEHMTRKQIFHQNWKLVAEHNSKNLGYKLGMNHLSDRTDAEMRRMSGARRSSPPTAPLPFPHSAKEVEELVQELPEEFDQRVEGYMSPVKNQGSCGSCWAFATTVAVEGALSRALGRNLVLSDQSLLDCSWGVDASGNQGCEGGWPQDALKHVMKHGLPLDEEYGGYLGQNGYCHVNETEPYKIRGFSLATPLSVAAAKVALHKYGPLAVLIQVTKAFGLYASGVFYDPECKEDEVGHAVNIVGYGIRDGTEYWIVRNSWGERWGEDGYMLLSTNNNNCFVLDAPYYAIV